jgi:hypothetical protein
MTIEEQIKDRWAEYSADEAKRRAAEVVRSKRDARGGMSPMLKALLALAAAIVIMAGVWTAVASAYRSQHCIYLLGHWLSVERTTNPLFCQ